MSELSRAAVENYQSERVYLKIVGVSHVAGTVSIDANHLPGVPLRSYYNIPATQLRMICRIDITQRIAQDQLYEIKDKDLIPQQDPSQHGYLRLIPTEKVLEEGRRADEHKIREARLREAAKTQNKGQLPQSKPKGLMAKLFG